MAEKFDKFDEWPFSLLTFLSCFSYGTYHQFVKVLYMLHSSKFFLIKLLYNTVAIAMYSYTILHEETMSNKSWLYYCNTVKSANIAMTKRNNNNGN